MPPRKRDGVVRGESVESSSPSDGRPHFAPQAKSVIWFCMLGGTSHVESFDPKPALNKYAGKTLEETPFNEAIVKSPYYRSNVRDFAGVFAFVG